MHDNYCIYHYKIMQPLNLYQIFLSEKCTIYYENFHNSCHTCITKNRKNKVSNFIYILKNKSYAELKVDPLHLFDHLHSINYSVL